MLCAVLCGMFAHRHSLTHLWGSLTVLVCLACEQAHEAADARDAAADGGGDAGRVKADGDVDAGGRLDAGRVDADGGRRADSDAGDTGMVSPPYKLCDGSDQIRFGFQSGGGFVDPSYVFLHPYGGQFLYIDGHCDFWLAEYSDASGSIIRGHLDQSVAEEVEQQLRLDELSTGVFVDHVGCPDGPTSTIATTEFFGTCFCGCDPGTPPALQHSFEVLTDTLARVRGYAAAPSGEIEVIAVITDPAFTHKDAASWPFSWPVADILNDTLRDESKPLKSRVLAGADAEAVRGLRRDQVTARDKSLLVQSGNSTYQLYARDRLEPEVADRISSFTMHTNPAYAQPLSACGSDEDVSVQLGAEVYAQRIRVWFQSGPICGVRVCWDGEFLEQQPAVAPLRVVKLEQPRPCLSRPEISPVDLEPLVAAFKTSYPGAAVEIELALAGWEDEEVGKLILKPTP